jgi:hypothetical protein
MKSFDKSFGTFLKIKKPFYFVNIEDVEFISIASVKNIFFPQMSVFP